MKPHPTFWMALLSVTLSDLQTRFQGYGNIISVYIYAADAWSVCDSYKFLFNTGIYIFEHNTLPSCAVTWWMETNDQAMTNGYLQKARWPSLTIIIFFRISVL